MWEEATQVDPAEEELRANERKTLGLILRCCPPEQVEIADNRRLTLPKELAKILERSKVVSPWCFYLGYQRCIHLVSACFWREYRSWVAKKVKNREARELILNGVAGARFERTRLADGSFSLFGSKFRRVTIPEYFCVQAGISPERHQTDKAVITGAHAADQSCSWLELWNLERKVEYDGTLLAGKPLRSKLGVLDLNRRP
jgi:hypothetical protein